MNGRRDFGMSMAEYSDGRRQRDDSDNTVFTVNMILMIFGAAAFFTGMPMTGLILFGVATVIGIINWR
jgi:hypothetical protein